MAVRDFDGIFYIRNPPTIEIIDGLFHICYSIGSNARFQIVLSPNNFQKSIRNAGKALDSFHARESVVPIRKKKGDH